MKANVERLRAMRDDLIARIPNLNRLERPKAKAELSIITQKLMRAERPPGRKRRKP